VISSGICTEVTETFYDREECWRRVERNQYADDLVLMSETMEELRCFINGKRGTGVQG